MKKTFILVIAAICALCLALCLAACSGGETGGAGGEKNEHVHNYGELTPEQPATCTEEGLQAHYYCSGCQTYFDDEKRETTLEDLKIDVDSTAHNYGELVPEQPATCTDEGLASHYHCVDCNKYFNSSRVETPYEDLKIDVNPNAHKWGSDGKCEYCHKKPVYTESDDHAKIYFGEYPQSEVEESGLKATLSWEAGNGTLPTAENANGWTDYNYYINGEVQSYMWYIDVEYENNRYRGVYFTSYRPYWTTHSSSTYTSNQDDNGYEINTAYWFRYEPIEWRILDQKDGTALLMSNMILDSQQFYHETEGTRTIDGKAIYPNNYKESDIRAWLNGTFYDTAFDELAKSIIQQTEVDNSASSTSSSSNQYACENTNDNIFLLSQKEITTSAYGFSSNITYDTARRLKSTAYAKSQGVDVSTSYYDGNSGWWLRSPCGDNSYRAFDVGSEGYANKYYRNVDFTERGIVPALWIKL